MTGHEAQQILMDEKRAIGVRLKNGQEMTGKVVVSNAMPITHFRTSSERTTFQLAFGQSKRG